VGVFFNSLSEQTPARVCTTKRRGMTKDSLSLDDPTEWAAMTNFDDVLLLMHSSISARSLSSRIFHIIYERESVRKTSERLFQLKKVHLKKAFFMHTIHDLYCKISKERGMSPKIKCKETAFFYFE
jgi:hypothetical protein